ncbi:hypothetical protein DSO57_1004010 [Entomophthora muscae]|uniref:Uncharacterized protein n=1 Tax=Entomophthora muscae TaxID=34485 RepID=A0ACC2SL03_9FUNG|nr:hypothetical protein DSO57_1004010 [Entomophthora muscae]
MMLTKRLKLRTFSLFSPFQNIRRLSSISNRPFQIAIDGPAASGKSTTAKLVAEELKFTYLNTGNLYRTVTLKALEEDLWSKKNKYFDQELTELASKLDIRLDGNHVWLEGRDVSKEIRNVDVTSRVSEVAKVAGVRECLSKIQRELACRPLEKDFQALKGIVMEGRDIGSSVLPAADIKVFLDANVKSRALRRFKELKGEATLEEIETAIRLRDESDYRRAISPLVKPKDATIVDTSNLTIPEQVAIIVTLAKKRISNSD